MPIQGYQSTSQPTSRSSSPTGGDKQTIPNGNNPERPATPKSVTGQAPTQTPPLRQGNQFHALQERFNPLPRSPAPAPAAITRKPVQVGSSSGNVGNAPSLPPRPQTSGASSSTPPPLGEAPPTLPPRRAVPSPQLAASSGLENQPPLSHMWHPDDAIAPSIKKTKSGFSLSRLQQQYRRLETAVVKTAGAVQANVQDRLGEKYVEQRGIPPQQTETMEEKPTLPPRPNVPLSPPSHGSTSEPSVPTRRTFIVPPFDGVRRNPPSSTVDAPPPPQHTVSTVPPPLPRRAVPVAPSTKEGEEKTPPE
jgi:hypothetical protein